MTSVAASFFGPLTAAAPQGGGTGTGDSGGQAFGELLAVVQPVTLATAAATPGGTMPQAPAIATLLAGIADFAPVLPMGDVPPAISGEAPAVIDGNPPAHTMTPAVFEAAPAAMLEPAPISLQPTPASAQAPSAFPISTLPAISPARPPETLGNAAGTDVEWPSVLAGRRAGVQIAPERIAAARIATPAPLGTTETADAAATAPALPVMPPAEPATASMRVPVEEVAALPVTPTARPKAARDMPDKADSPAADAPVPPVPVLVAIPAPMPTAAALTVPTAAAGLILPAKRMTISSGADAPVDVLADLPESGSEPEPAATFPVGFLPAEVTAPPVAKTTDAASPAASSTRSEAIQASTASNPREPAPIGVLPTVSGDRAAPIVVAGDRAAPDGHDDGAPSQAAPIDRAAVATSAVRDAAPAFIPAMAAAPPAAAAVAASGRSGTITAQPGRIGQEVGVAIAHHVAAGTGATGGGETITLRLDPVDMGRIEVKMSFDDGGVLRAVVSADNPAALDMLRRDSADLGRALVDAGVRADTQTLRFDTRAGTGQDGGNDQSRGQPRQRQPEPGAGTAIDTPDDVTAIYRPLRTRGGIDMVA